MNIKRHKNRADSKVKRTKGRKKNDRKLMRLTKDGTRANTKSTPVRLDDLISVESNRSDWSTAKNPVAYVPGSVFTELPMPGYTDTRTIRTIRTSPRRQRQHFVNNSDSSLDVKNTVKEPQASEEKLLTKILATVRKLLAKNNKQELTALAEMLCQQAIMEVSEFHDEDSESLLELELANLKLLYQKRKALLENSITSTQVAEILNWKHRKTVHDRARAGELIGIKDKGIYKFPLWQFDPEGEDGILDGLPELLSALEISDFRKLSWLTKPLRTFENKTPIEILKRGDREEIEELIIEAEGVGVL